jgi:hypothetical protein
MIHKVKKARERRVFDMVYGDRPRLEIVDSEHPDFLVRLRNELPHFGVEVAEFYHSESEARLQRIPGYVGDLLDRGEFRHKDDKCALTLDNVNILTPDNQVKAAGIKTIIQQVPTLTDCAGMVVDLVRDKDAKLRDAFNWLSHVNLVVCDRTGLLGHLDPSAFYNLYCLAPLKAALFSCRFREVFFVTRFSNGWSYLPLKMLILLAELYFFQAVLKKPEYRDCADSVREVVKLFASYLSGAGAGDVRFRCDQEGYETVYGDCGILVTNDLAVRVRTYLDWPLPSDSSVIRSDFVQCLGQRFFEDMAQFQADNTFVTELCFPVKLPDAPDTSQSVGSSE